VCVPGEAVVLQGWRTSAPVAGAGTHAAGPVLLDRSQIATLVASLTGPQVMTLLREGWCVYSRKPGERGGLATDTRSSLACQQSRYSVTALAHRQDVIDAVLSQDGPQLTHLAANLLADRKPQMSARAMLSGRQIVAALLVLAAAGGLALAWPEALKITLMTSFAILFLAVSAIRLASLAGPGHGIQGAAHGHKLNDAELPVYTVLGWLQTFWLSGSRTCRHVAC
jgi:hypothetical protein